MDKRIYMMHADMCKVFTSPVRLKILDILRNGEKSVSELVRATGLNQSNISQHLQIMKDNNIKKLPVVENEDIVGIITVTDISRVSPDLSKRFIESWVKPKWRD